MNTSRSPIPAHASVVRRVVHRLPLASQAVPIAGAFYCSCLLYDGIARRLGIADAVPVAWTWLAGAASLLLLFVVLRLVDDLDDVDRDCPTASAAQRSTRRTQLRAGIAACMVTIGALNHAHPHALFAVIAASALAFAGPFWFKRHFANRLALASLLFEGAPLLVFAYIYFYWRDTTGTALPASAAAPVIALFWIGYEFWKFSRKVHSHAMQPYLLSSGGVRVVLNLLLAAALIANVALARAAMFSLGYAAYAVFVALGMCLWLNSTWPAADRPIPQRRPLWAAMTLVWAIELGVLMQVLFHLGVDKVAYA